MRLSLAQKIDQAHDDAVWSAAYLPNSDFLLTGSVDESVKLWTHGEQKDKLEAGHTYLGHTLGVVSVAVDPSGQHAASSALDSFIRVWHLLDSSTRAVIESPPSETWQIAFSPEKDLFQVAAAGGSGNKITIYDIKRWDDTQEDTKQPAASLPLPTVCHPLHAATVSLTLPTTVDFVLLHIS